MSTYLLDLSKEFAGRRALVTARNVHVETPKGAGFVAGDTRTKEGADKVAKEAIQKLGGLDILVNSAGAARVILGDSASIPEEDWLDSLNINFLASLRITYAALPELVKAKGKIVNVSAGGRVVFGGGM